MKSNEHRLDTKASQYRGTFIILGGACVAAVGMAISIMFEQGALRSLGRALFWIGWLIGGVGMTIHFRLFVKSILGEVPPRTKQPWEK